MKQANPFLELYLTEGIAPNRFAKLFSPVLAQQSQTHTLFQPGNIVLVGLQGAGKTSLLNLMRPEIMISYRRLGKGSWPLPKTISKFVSAGINLNTSKARDFGQRTVSEGDNNIATNALLFGDFINYWVANDLLDSIELISNDSETEIFHELQIDAHPLRLDNFAKELALCPCWFGGLHGTTSYKDLRERIARRIFAYRSFLNYNSDLPKWIISSKTSAGEPIAEMADILKRFEIVPDDITVLIRIDQFEDLMGIERGTVDSAGIAFRQVVMKMISERDSRISYRVGSRPYALYPDFNVFGASSPAEELRNFKILDIGDLFRGRESRPSLFKEFCEDVFRRRLDVDQDEMPHTLANVFGGREDPADRARQYVKSNPNNVITSRESLAKEQILCLEKIASTDPLSAHLGEAWLLQQEHRHECKVNAEVLEKQPWNSRSRKWWKKERVQQALIQIAANQRQRMMWYGSRDLLGLSGGNVLVFLSLCQFIWAEYLRSVSNFTDIPSSISPLIQHMGIHETSFYWFRKIKADPNGGDDRYRFVNVLGSDLRNYLRDDRRMSYPGASGFSLSDKEMAQNPEVEEFLNKCVAYGVLESFRHTSKTKSRGPSKKWYLFPILTPYFQIPTPRIKEPRYIRVKLIGKWMKSAQVYCEIQSTRNDGSTKRAKNQGGQLSFDLDTL